MTARRLLDPVTRTLLDAAELIERRGWWDGSGTTSGFSGPLCADLAIGVASGGDFAAYNAAYERLCRQVGRYHIPKWNDNEARNGEAVLAALRAAALCAPLAVQKMTSDCPQTPVPCPGEVE